MNHPMWVQLSRHINDVDQTGHLIAKLSYRPDARGLRAVAAQVKVHPLWHNSGDTIFLGTFVTMIFRLAHAILM